VEWPDEAEEAAFLSEAAAQGESTPERPRDADAPVLGDRLPPLDELVARVPPGLREMLDEHFRAKFTAVRRFPARDAT
jgi:hypothetical protein